MKTATVFVLDEALCIPYNIPCRYIMYGKMRVRHYFQVCACALCFPLAIHTDKCLVKSCVYCEGYRLMFPKPYDSVGI